MATQLFLTNGISDYNTGNNDANLIGGASKWAAKTLTTSRGAVAVALSAMPTVTGPTNGVEVNASGVSYVWYSPPLDADITISGSITWNLRASESANAANCAINGRLEIIDGATGAITLIDQTARTIELTTSEAAANFAETPAAGVACKRGDRLRVRVFADDGGGNMGSGQSFAFWYNGPTAAASGDSYLTLTENLTFAGTPAGSTVYPTDTASAVSTASVDREAWTSRGAGVQTDVTNTVTGFTAPLQVTDTAGGTVVDWFTRPLAAMTLGGAVRVNVRASESSGTANTAMRCEIARVAGDGTSPTAWAAGTMMAEIQSGSEAAHSFLVSGDDLAISDGQRLRIRFLIDDVTDSAAGGMATGFTVTLYYAGTTGGASGDTWLTFSQTLTEYSAATPVTGTGAGTGTASGATGTAAETMSGTGAGTGTAATASGSATETITATGAAIGTAPSATGLASESMTGSGAGSQTAQTATGSGDVATLGDISGSGAGVQVAQSGSGEGTVEGGVEVPPVIEGSTIYAPKLRVISGGGGGTQARQSAKGRGTVNDDDLVVLAA